MLSNRYQWPPSESTGSNIDYTSSYCGSVATTMRQLEPAYAEPPRLNSIARKPRGRRLHPTALPNHLTPPLGAKFANTSRMQPDADSPIQDHPPVAPRHQVLPVYSFFTAVTIKQYPLPILIHHTTAPKQSPMMGGLAPISCLAYPPPARESQEAVQTQKQTDPPFTKNNNNMDRYATTGQHNTYVPALDTEPGYPTLHTQATASKTEHINGHNHGATYTKANLYS